MHCAVVLDTFCRAVVAWSIDSEANAALVTRALGMAIYRRGPEGRRDPQRAGSEARAGGYPARQERRAVPSMGSVGDCCDDALIPAPASHPGRVQRLAYTSCKSLSTPFSMACRTIPDDPSC